MAGAEAESPRCSVPIINDANARSRSSRAANPPPPLTVSSFVVVEIRIDGRHLYRELAPTAIRRPII
ncbi:hypothetical protein V9T40_003772 [Parthenolecanium corni]|uniref:Uncharacterized protein n=1 Tax=Parthenolecanium corni TaxID=536013 RepID=A0AAN9U2Z8_9HEMI